MRFASAICVGTALLGLATAAADESSYFRKDGGVAGDAHPLPDNFDDDARLVWKTELAPGNSTPCVCGDLVVATAWREGRRELATIALDRASGRVRWERAIRPDRIEPFHPVGSPASCTPACNGRQIFVFFGSYGLLAYDLEGNLLWEKRMGPFQDEFGASSSPILVDNLVILNEDHDVDSFLIAIDQQTGETVWKTQRVGVTRSYSTPIVVQDGPRREVVVAGSLQMTAYDVETGQRLWWVNGLSRIVDPTPIVSNGLIYLATWTPGGDESERISMEPFPEALAAYDKNDDDRIELSELPGDSPVVPRFFRIDLDQDGKLDQAEWEKHARVFELAQNVALAIRPGGRGDVTDSHVEWVHRKSLPTVPSSVVYNGVLYMVKDSGIISSVDAQTGELLQRGRAEGRGNYYASLVAGDGKVYVSSERGVVTVLEAGRPWEILSSHDFGARIMATPVIEGGRVYLRTDAALYCFEKR